MNQGVNLKLVTLDLIRSEVGSYIYLEQRRLVSLEVRTVTVCLFMHMRMCERDGWTQRKKVSTVASDGIWRTDMWRESEREREIE